MPALGGRGPGVNSAPRVRAIQSLGSDAPKDATIERVELLGAGEVKFTREAARLALTLPDKAPTEFAVVF